MNHELLKQIHLLNENRTPFVLVTIVDASGSLPQEIGARCLITSVGILSGTVGGGKLEAWAIEKAKHFLAKKEKTFFTKLNLQRDIGMSCGGEASLFFESHNNNTWNIAVFGAGHVSQSLCRILETLDCHIYCIDTRKEWLDKLPVNSTKITKLLVDEYSLGIEKIPLDSFILTITKGHAYDLEILTHILKMNFPFIGGIGSKVKSISLKNELKKFGLSQMEIEKFHCPVGMAFGNNTPAEIAISITAQLLSEKEKNSLP